MRNKTRQDILNFVHEPSQPAPVGATPALPAPSGGSSNDAANDTPAATEAAAANAAETAAIQQHAESEQYGRAATDVFGD